MEERGHTWVLARRFFTVRSGGRYATSSKNSSSSRGPPAAVAAASARARFFAAWRSWRRCR